jgi:hypothetical protein
MLLSLLPPQRRRPLAAPPLSLDDGVRADSAAGSLAGVRVLVGKVHLAGVGGNVAAVRRRSVSVVYVQRAVSSKVAVGLYL